MHPLSVEPNGWRIIMMLNVTKRKSSSLQNCYVLFEKKKKGLTHKLKPKTSNVSESNMLILSI